MPHYSVEKPVDQHHQHLVSLTLHAPMDSSLWFDTIKLGCFIVCKEGSQVINSNFFTKLKYTMHNKFSNFLCFAFFLLLIFVPCRSISIAMKITGS